MRKPLVAFAAMTALACMSACGAGGTGDGRSSMSYVALGDSYTAAPYVGTNDATSTCGRSPINYPHLLAEKLGDVHLTDVSCGGATTADITGSQEGEAPQLAAVTPDTDLVTISIGGNDLRFSGVLLFQCPLLRSQDPEGAPCRKKWGAWAQRVLPELQKNVTSVLRKVRKKAPDAQIVFIDYPRMVGASGTCPTLPVAVGDVAFLSDLLDDLDDAVLAAARHAGVESLDLREASAAHDICSDDPWINGLRDIPGKAAAMHPFANEQRAVADLLAKMVRN